MFKGFEVDMLSVGNADCILVTHWAEDWVVRVLIDGGNKGDAEQVRGFLRARGINFLGAVVCTHPHDDHAAGLLELLKDKDIKIGTAYMHVPGWHVDPMAMQKALSSAAGSAEADAMRKSLSTTQDLLTAFAAREIQPTEPFAGTQIGILTVVGPSRIYYEDLLKEFTDAERIKAIDKAQSDYDLWSRLHDHALDALDTDLPSNPQTTPENNSSVILKAVYENQKYLFTSDAGVPALQKASEQYDLTCCHWMQIPHHGSRRNINPALVKLFSPTFAWVSAEGSKKHPRRAVVNLFKEAGATVYSTHYPTPTSMWKHSGNVPIRGGYNQLIPLYDAPVKLPPPPGLDFLSSLMNAK